MSGKTPQASPLISLVIPAYNEESLLPALLDSVDAARRRYRGGHDAIEVIVADNRSSDATATIARQRGCRIAAVEKRLIAASRNGGAAIAKGEIVCFIDADSRIHENTFNAIEDTLASGKVIVGATRIKPERWSPGILATWMIALPICYLSGVDAGVIFCRKQDFDTIGGYDETMEYAEDIKILVDLKRLGRTRGQGFARARGAITTASMRKFDKHGDWHYLTRMPRVAFWLLVDKKRVERYTQAYWYEDR